MKTTNNSKRWMLVLFTSLLFITALQAQSRKDIQAKLKLTTIGKNICIKAIVINNTLKKQESLHYELVLVSNIKKKSYKKLCFGNFVILSGESKLLFEQKLLFNSKNALNIQLIISRKDGAFIGKHSLMVYNRTEFNKTNSEAVFSDQGSLFCNYLNQINNLKTIRYPFEVRVIEKPSQSTVFTEIFIMINNQLIYKFKSLSKSRYLIAAAQETDKKITAYLQKNEVFLLAED